MEQEWIRNDTWVDWKGNIHTAKAEFDYASSPVPRPVYFAGQGYDATAVLGTPDATSQQLKQYLENNAATTVLGKLQEHYGALPHNTNINSSSITLRQLETFFSPVGE
jgi:hypothetical protein